MTAQPNIVLVHGAWADGSSWSPTIERLQADGYKVTAPQFGLNKLADDVARLRHVLSRQDGPTIVAGHSYGGQIMTALGTDAPTTGASPGCRRTTSSITSPPMSIRPGRRSCSPRSNRCTRPHSKR